MSSKGQLQRDNHDLLEVVREWAPKDVQSYLYATREAALTAYVLDLSLRIIPDCFPAANGLLPTLQEWEMELHILSPKCPATGTPPGNFRQMVGNLKGRLFIVAKDGYFGLGPPRTEPR
jgi:hypothetical protein